MTIRSCTLVSHTHWDREWYRPFESFRARLVDAVDRVLDQLAADPGWSFLLDGQTVVLEDYLAVRPGRRDELAAACQAGRLAIGPWYVQPDSLLPTGEAHVRNLLEGRRVGRQLGPVSTVAYTPDSFGHPAQFPMIFAGFGLGPFVYWRGNGNELDHLSSVWRWEAPGGAAIVACHLAGGYFAAAYLGADAERTAKKLEQIAVAIADDSTADLLLMNGVDHAPPDTNTGEVAAALAERTGWDVYRGLLDDYAARLDPPTTSFTGELVGGKVANLLPGVWSTRLYLKQRDRACDAALTGWAEPFAALGRALGGPDEQPSIRTAWRSLLVNQAHDSICGCSVDPVHEQMLGRYDSSAGLASETTRRLLERLSGLGVDRRVPMSETVDIAVWNPSPHPLTDVVRFPLNGQPVFAMDDANLMHPLNLATLLHKGFTIDGEPAHLVFDSDAVVAVQDQRQLAVEFVARDVPGMGYRTFTLAPGEGARPVAGDGTTIEVAKGERDSIAATAAADGTITITAKGRTWSGLLGVEDTGDRGDSYDYDPVGANDALLRTVDVRPRTLANGVVELVVTRAFDVPAEAAADRAERSSERVPVMLATTVRLVPGTGRVDVDVTLDNTARDHRLRLLFPVGATSALAATTFDAVARTADRVDDSGWKQPAPRTFAHQGWVAAGGLVIGAPGLPEAEITESGDVAITLVRSVGWLGRIDLPNRPEAAGPGMPTPGAQCLGRFTTTLHVWPDAPAPGDIAARARAAELGLRAVPAGSLPIVDAGASLLALAPSSLVLSALKPAEDGDGFVVRVLNFGDADEDAVLRFGVPVDRAVAVRLDESVDEGAGDVVRVEGATVRFPVSAHATTSVYVSTRSASR